MLSTVRLHDMNRSYWCLSVIFGAYGNIDAISAGSAGILYVFGPSLLGFAVVIVYLADKYIGWNDTMVIEK